VRLSFDGSSAKTILPELVYLEDFYSYEIEFTDLGNPSNKVTRSFTPTDRKHPIIPPVNLDAGSYSLKVIANNKDGYPMGRATSDTGLITYDPGQGVTDGFAVTEGYVTTIYVELYPIHDQGEGTLTYDITLIGISLVDLLLDGASINVTPMGGGPTKVVTLVEGQNEDSLTLDSGFHWVEFYIHRTEGTDTQVLRTGTVAQIYQNMTSMVERTFTDIYLGPVTGGSAVDGGITYLHPEDTQDPDFIKLYGYIGSNSLEGDGSIDNPWLLSKTNNTYPWAYVLDLTGTTARCYFDSNVVSQFQNYSQVIIGANGNPGEIIVGGDGSGNIKPPDFIIDEEGGEYPITFWYPNGDFGPFTIIKYFRVMQ
jgi:hypothetical protein